MANFNDFVPELVGLGVDAVICALLYKGLSVTTRVLTDLSTASQIDIEDNIKHKIEANQASIVDQETGTAIIPYAVIRGRVNPLGKVISSAYSSDQLRGVIQRVIFKEHKRHMSRTGFWIDTEKLIHQYTNDAPFCLSNPRADSVFSLLKPYVEVQDWIDAAKVDLGKLRRSFYTVYDNYETSSGSLGSHIWGWLTGDMQKGVQTSELMMTTGTELTAIGQLVSGPAGVKIQPPSDGRPFYLVRNSLSSLIKEVKGERMTLIVFLGLFSGIGASLLAWSAVKYYKKTIATRLARANLAQLENIRTARAARPEGRQDIPEALQCVICLVAEREVIFNCGHVCVCADCADTLVSQGHRCPVCRAVIHTVMPAFVS